MKTRKQINGKTKKAWSFATAKLQVKRQSLLTLQLLCIVATLALFGCGGDDTTTETFTVTFHANGGAPEPTQQTIDKDGKATEPPAMTKEKSDFEGWYKESGFTTKWNFTTDTVTANIDLYAKWEAYYSKLPNGINIYKDNAELTDEQMTTAIANVTTALGLIVPDGWLTSEELEIAKNNVRGIKVIGTGTGAVTFSKESGKYVIAIRVSTHPDDICAAFYDISVEISGS